MSVTFLFGEATAAAGTLPARPEGATARLEDAVDDWVVEAVINVEAVLRLAKLARAAERLPACLFF